MFLTLWGRGRPGFRYRELLAKGGDVTTEPCNFSEHGTVVTACPISAQVVVVFFKFGKVLAKLRWAVETAGSNVSHHFLQYLMPLERNIAGKDAGNLIPLQKKSCAADSRVESPQIGFFIAAWGTLVAYEWDAGRARRARMIKRFDVCDGCICLERPHRRSFDSVTLLMIGARRAHVFHLSRKIDMVILASPNTVGYSPKVRFVVTMIELGSYSLLIKWNRS
jgi:hypothetical protein